MKRCIRIFAWMLVIATMLSATGISFATEGEVSEPGTSQSFEVRFLDHDGTILSIQAVPAGSAATAPSNPLRPGYRFMGWNQDFSSVTEEMTVTATYRVIESVQTYGKSKIVGEWVWASTVYALGADTVVERCAKYGITDIYLLTKGTKGTLYYNHTQYTDNLNYTDRDILDEMVDAAHAVGIRIHAWLSCGQDATYKAAYPEAGLYHYTKGRDNNNIALNDQGYRTYMTNIVKEILSQYDVDGIHLDYIRYNILLNGWSDQDFANLKAMGANLDRAKYLLNKTYYQNKLPAGDTVDSNYIFKQYKNGDKNALLMGQYRRNNVVSFATALRNAAKAIDSKAIFSGAIMPEGITSTASSDLHYGQNYTDTPNLFDYVVPMAYTTDYGYTSQKLGEMTKTCASKGNKVVMGIQVYDAATHDRMIADIAAVESQLSTSGVQGIALFRHGQTNYAKTSYSYTHGTAIGEVTNTSDLRGYVQLDVKAASGVTITGIELTDGISAQASVTLISSGSIGRIRSNSDATEPLVAPLGDGVLKITFTGKPTNTTASPFTILGYFEGEEQARVYQVGKDISGTCQWDKGVVTQEATCGHTGTKLYTCIACDATKTEEIPMGQVHTYDEGIITLAPTCIQEGERLYTCTVCGKTETEVVPIDGEHTYDEGVILEEATCRESGVRLLTCILCGKERIEKLPILGVHTYDEGVITLETSCGESGEKTFTCTICGKTRIEPILPLGEHCYDQGILTAEPTCKDSGELRFTCTLCGKVKVEVLSPTEHSYTYVPVDEGHRGTCIHCGGIRLEEHSFLEGLCVCGEKTVTVDETIQIGHTLDLTSDISIKFVVREAQLEHYDSYYMECILPVYEGNEQVGTKTVVPRSELRNGYCYFTLNGLSSLEMNNVVEARLYMTKGERSYASEIDRYSIADYAYKQLRDTRSSEALKGVCANLLRYGAKAQLWRGYRTDALADSAMTEEQRAYLLDLDAVSFTNHKKYLGDHSDPAVPILGAILSLDSRIVVRYIVQVGEYDGNLEDLSLRINYVGVDGKSKEATITDIEVYYEPYGYYMFSFDGLLASELRTVMSAVVYEGTEPVSETMEYSVDSYGVGTEGVILTLMQAMMAYSDSARGFFSR